MITYPLLVETLRGFGLITDWQADAAIADFEREWNEHHERRAEFERAWKERSPWWKRWFGRSWVYDFLDAERER